MQKKTTLLCILDGWGERQNTQYNAIFHASTPNWDNIKKNYVGSSLYSSGHHVGLPEGQMGNSEVGHMNIGTGRIILQNLPKINQAIKQDNLKNNSELTNAIASLKNTGGVFHLLGLLSDGGVHSHEEHILYLAKTIANQGVEVAIHGFLDGRDVAPQAAAKSLQGFLDKIAQDQNIKLASICGRYYAMDRDNNWDRVNLAYKAIKDADAIKSSDFIADINKSYLAKVTDEFIKPYITKDYQGMQDGDGFMMLNFRADRVRQIIRAFLDKNCKPDLFASNKVKFATKLGMVEYSQAINNYLPCLFTNNISENTLSDVLVNKAMKQLHIAETEKYAHVTFFFNGGKEESQKGEDRILVPSPAVATYDLKPEMSAYEVTEKLVEVIKLHKYDFIVVNYANPDMVGHTGNWQAAKQAVEHIDKILGELEEVILDNDGNMLITADHGNIEQMFNPDNGQAHTAHTLSMVPFILVKKAQENIKLEDGRLCDIAPTILELININQPKEMTGKSLIKNIK
jgi:2,3-bisphosphoglycerate-independent phosphoglycerate mutase